MPARSARMNSASLRQFRYSRIPAATMTGSVGEDGHPEEAVLAADSAVEADSEDLAAAVLAAVERLEAGSTNMTSVGYNGDLR